MSKDYYIETHQDEALDSVQKQGASPREYTNLGQELETLHTSNTFYVATGSNSHEALIGSLGDPQKIPSQNHSESWKELLLRHFGQTLYQDWFRHLTFGHFAQGRLVLRASSRFVKDWIETHYLDLIASLMGRELPGCLSVSLELTAETIPIESSHAPSLNTTTVSLEDDKDIPSASLDLRLTFDQFVVGKPNEFAYAAACRVAESKEAIYNPLFLYGPVGHGKTHLMHSIAHAIHKNSQGQKNILYLSAEKFMYYFIRALRYKNILAFKERLRSVDVLMIDDVQFISGKESTQEEFFHTFNALVDLRRQVVISADKSPADLDGIQERMKSRLGWGLVADLHPTTYELRLGILQSKAASQSIHVPMEILDFLASHVSSSVRELEGALTRVIAHSSLIGRELSLDFVRSLLKDIIRPYSQPLTLEEIEKRVADYFHLRVTDLHSAKRARTIVRPRQIAMFLAKQLTSTSLPAIGRHFGGRDHTTVMHAISTIENMLQRDKALREDVTLLHQSLENR